MTKIPRAKMKLKFLIKDEDLPKTTILSIIHMMSIILPLIVVSFKSFLEIAVTYGVWEVIQVIYLSVFYKKIVLERYASAKLRRVTISFISTNVYLVIITLIHSLKNVSLTWFFPIASTLLVFVLSLILSTLITEKNYLSKIKSVHASSEGFSFPFYKFTAIIPMYFVVLSVIIKSKTYIAVSLSLLTIGSLYSALGEYFHTKKKDELDKLIKYEASFIAMQFLPAFVLPLYLLEVFFKLQIPWFYCLFGFIMIHALIQAVINKKYE